MSYLLATKDQVMDLNTWQFMPKSSMQKPFELQVPIYFWRFRELATHKKLLGKSVYRKITSIGLNDLIIQVNADNCYVIINTDKGQKKFLVCPRHKHSAQTYGMQFYILESVKYTIFCDDRSIEHHTKVSGQPLTSPAFIHKIPDLARSDIWDKYDNAYLLYGIMPTKYSIIYGKHDIKRQNYAMLCGTWAVLLTDDMKFNSLVLLKGATEDSLYIDKFIYSLDPHIVKLMVLGERRES